MIFARRLIIQLDQIPQIARLPAAQDAEVAVILPQRITAREIVHAFEELVALCATRGLKVTVIGGNAEFQAAAVVNGLRASSSIGEWERWLNDAEIRAYRQERRRQAAPSTWRVLRFAAPHESQPGFITAIGQRAGLPATAPRVIPADERYEATIIAMIQTTGGYAIADTKAM